MFGKKLPALAAVVLLSLGLTACNSASADGTASGSGNGAASQAADNGQADGGQNSVVVNDPDNDKAPNPCTLLKSGDIQAALGIASDADKVNGWTSSAVRQDEAGTAWARQCSFHMDGGDKDVNFVTVTIERFNDPATGANQAAEDYQKSADSLTGGDSVVKGRDAGVAPIGDNNSMAYVNPSKLGTMDVLHGNMTLQVLVNNIPYPGGDYQKALTALANAANSRL